MSASGTWTMKIDCQEMSCVSRPPMAGPRAAPAMPATAHTRTARFSPPASSGSSSSAAQTAAAPPMPCRARAPIRKPSVGASAHAADDAANSTRPPAHTRPAGSRVASRAAGTAVSAIARLNDVTTQATSATSAWYSR